MIKARDFSKTSSRAWRLKSRPRSTPTADNFELASLERPPMGEGMIHAHSSWLSVDPYMRGRMDDEKSYLPPFEIGGLVEGGAVGQVVDSRSIDYPVGSTVRHFRGWREVAVGPGADLELLPPMPVPIPDGQWLGNFGLTGSTAYFGLLRVARARKEETIFVSAAAGGVGSAVVQIAKARGLRVIASDSGRDKCVWVRTLDANEVDEYKSGPIAKLLARAAPEGIEIYFDNVGGNHLDAALSIARQGARFAMCGMIASYSSCASTSLYHLLNIVKARVTLEDFIVADYEAETPDFYRDMNAWMASGQVLPCETTRDGIDSAAQAFTDLLSGGNLGKMLIRLRR